MYPKICPIWFILLAIHDGFQYFVIVYNSTLVQIRLMIFLQFNAKPKHTQRRCTKFGPKNLSLILVLQWSGFIPDYFPLLLFQILFFRPCSPPPRGIEEKFLSTVSYFFFLWICRVCYADQEYHLIFKN